MAWLGTWANRIKLTIDSSKVDTANLTDFPVMVKLSTASGIGDVDVSAVFDELTSDANRKKIAVTTSDGTTQCYVEIEKWDDANEQAWLHVKVPTVAYNADTVLYLYYDSTQSDNTSYVGDTTDAVTHNVWDSDFEAVYHLAQDPNGDGVDAIKDSTSNGNDGTPDGSMTTADLVTAKVGKGLALDGSDDYIDLGDILDIGTGQVTIEGIVNQTANAFSGIASKVSLSGEGLGYGLIVYSDGKAGFWIGPGGWAGKLVYTDSAITGGDHYIAGKRDGSGDLYIYDNGVQQADTDNHTINTDNNVSMRIGSTYGDNTTVSAAILDEIRISSTARSAAWIKATYNSLWDSLVTFSDFKGNILATTATLTLTANAATISYDLDIQASAASLTITANTASVSYGISVSATAASLTLTANASGITHNVNLAANTATLALATQQANVALDMDITATIAALTLATNAADIEVDVVNVWGATAALTLSANSAAIKCDIPVSAIMQALTLATYDATIWDGAAWEAWIAANSDKLTRKYFFTLTGDADGTTDAAMPISSFQCRRYADRPTYLSVVIPDTNYASQINARANGDMKLEMSYEVNSVEMYRETITLVDLEDIQIDEGASNASITLIGHRTVSFTPKTITLRDIQYYRLKDGSYTVRCLSPDLYLNPGDTANADGNTFTVDRVAYLVSEQIQTMEVKEA